MNGNEMNIITFNIFDVIKIKKMTTKIVFLVQVITIKWKLNLQEQILKNDFKKQIDNKPKATRADIDTRVSYVKLEDIPG